MYDLTLIKKNGGCYIDSREVADVIGKPHNDLMKSIRKYSEYLTAGNFSLSGFFVESTYVDSTGRTLPCYLLTKMGCELVANKLTGDKGILFTFAYVSKFNEMERRERDELLALAAMPTPRLGEINACVRNFIRGLRLVGAPAEKIMEFLDETYEAFGITSNFVTESECLEHLYSAEDVARCCGIYSLNGLPHTQAVSCILNEILCIDEEHKRLVQDEYTIYKNYCARYDIYAIKQVAQWVQDNRKPQKIHGNNRTYSVLYV